MLILKYCTFLYLKWFKSYDWKRKMFQFPFFANLWYKVYTQTRKYPPDREFSMQNSTVFGDFTKKYLSYIKA